MSKNHFSSILSQCSTVSIKLFYFQNLQHFEEAKDFSQFFCSSTGNLYQVPGVCAVRSSFKTQLNWVARRKKAEMFCFGFAFHALRWVSDNIRYELAAESFWSLVSRETDCVWMSGAKPRFSWLKSQFGASIFWLCLMMFNVFCEG